MRNTIYEIPACGRQAKYEILETRYKKQEIRLGPAVIKILAKEQDILPLDTH
ncbi:MAG: hypothetical protein RLZZ358_2289 [Bacteroidota bacterium]|jgi:hypothetical protein